MWYFLFSEFIFKISNHRKVSYTDWKNYIVQTSQHLFELLILTIGITKVRICSTSLDYLQIHFGIILTLPCQATKALYFSVTEIR